MTKILVIDDDLDILYILQISLGQHDFDVTAVSKAKDVIQTVLNKQPDIILMDINLGGYDGRVLCRTLRKDSHLTIPIILFSAVREYDATAAEYGADGFIDKPFEIGNLIHTLYSYLN